MRKDEIQIGYAYQDQTVEGKKILTSFQHCLDF